MKKLLLLMATLLTGLLVQAQGIYQLWGMIPYGGDDNASIIFNTDAKGDNFKIKQQFTLSQHGRHPMQPVEYNGKFYGVAGGGVNAGAGTLYEWDPVTNIYTKKFDFDGNNNGEDPDYSLTVFNDKIYGSTSIGGNYGAGVIFEWNPITNVYTKKIDIRWDANGSIPLGSMVLHEGKFYGTTMYGGANDKGVIFEWEPVTNVYTKKIDFTDSDGIAHITHPTSNMTFYNGKFYGLTAAGGNSDAGFIFEWDPVTNAYSRKFQFVNSDSRNPAGSLKMYNGKFYGVTQQGGVNNMGTIFEWDPAINQFVKKIDFDGNRGNNPWSGLILKDNVFYGTTFYGGNNNSGTIFQWSPSTNVLTKKMDLAGSNGSRPASLIFYREKFVGTTLEGGNNDDGVIFEWDAVTNLYKVKFDLAYYSNGFNVSGSLTANNGNLYGMTMYGGSNNKGIIFQFNTTQNSITKMASFDGVNGRNPYGGSLTAIDNVFYGMTPAGGANNYGVIFKWDTSTNLITKSFDFDGVNGNSPMGSLTAKDGKLYGITNYGGINNSGVIFEWDPAAKIFTKKIDLSGVTGWNSYESLTLNNGKFYVITLKAGSNGVLYEWDPVANTLTTKFNFNRPDQGSQPYCQLTPFEGKFYGTTDHGGANSRGVIFEWDPLTSNYTKKFDFNDQGGSYPTSSLTVSNGKLYGLTHLGGTGNNAGTIFEWDPHTNIFTKKNEFDGYNNLSPNFGYGLTLARVASDGLPETCKILPSVTINATNNNQWVSIVDEENNTLAEIKANGNNLGIITASVFINNAAVREDGTGRLYLDRTITIKPQFPQKSPIDIRLYIKGTEYTALKNAHNSFGQTAGINSINDVGIFKINGGCQPVVATVSNLINTTGAAWENDYVLSASINSFTTFCFASKNPCAAPVITQVSTSQATLSPADHQMKNVIINYSAKGNCFPITTWLTVTSNEPVSGTGNGDLSPDWIIIDEHHLQLRSERSVSGTGRTYTITVNAKNAFGTYCKKTIKVVVTALPVTLAKAADGNNENGLFDCKAVPNPTSNYFNLQIQSASSEKIEVTLLDISGRLISKWTTVKGEINRFGENLKPGIYTIKIIQGQRQQMLQIVKQ